MVKKLSYLLAILLPFSLTAQEKWDLRKCVEYAQQNNISVKQADIDARISDLQLKSAKLSQIPSANFSTGLGTLFGRSIDPTTNQFTTIQSIYQNLGLSGGVVLYNFGRLKNSIAVADFNAAASLKGVEKAAYDIALNVVSYYINVLAAREQINIAEIQLKQTQTQLEDTRKRVEAGSLPELNLAEMEAQLANDSASLIGSQNTYDQNLLSLKALLNIDAAQAFDVETPPLDQIPLEPLADLQPEVVYELAKTNYPLQQQNELRIKSAESNIKVAKSSLYPSLSFGYNLSSNFSNSLKAIDPSSYQLTGSSPTSSFVSMGGVDYFVRQPTYTYDYSKKSFKDWWKGYGDQLSNNFGQSLGVTLSVPIFNSGNTYRMQYRQAELNLKGIQLQRDQADMDLKNNIYTAYNNAVASMKKYYVGDKSVFSAQKAYDFATKRYEIGLMNTVDLLTNQNKLLTAKLQQLSNRIDYVFRMKLLEFYKGQGLKL